MRHPAEGALRRLLDDPAGVADGDRRHVAGCPRCLGALAVAREDAVLVGAALAPVGCADVDVGAAWQRLVSAAPAPAAPRRAAAPPRPRRVPAFLRRPAAAGLAVAAVLTGTGAAAASGWLPIFRTERIAPVTLSAADLIALPDLSAYGELALTSEASVHEVPDAATAAAETGLDVPEVTALPRGISGKPAYQVGGKVSASFTFSPARAARTAARADETLPAPPPGLARSRVRLVAGPGVAQVWSSGTGAPALVVGRAVAPAAFSSGLSFEAVRDYLLALPGLPEDVAAQLRTYAANGSILPLPVRSEEITTAQAQVDGRPATVFATRDRTLAAVAWVDDGVVTAVAGALDADEVLAVAEGL